MSWHALGALDDAVDATRGFLLPFDLGRWLRLAVISIFVGGGLSVFNWSSEVPIDPVMPETPDDPMGAPAALDPVALLLLVVVATVTIAFVVAGPVMRFVLLDALRTDRVSIRDRFRARLGEGVRLLVFTLATGVLLIVSIVALFLAFTTGGVALVEQIPTSAGSLVGIAVLFFGVLAGLLAAVCAATFFHFTTAFVAPTMVATDSGVVAAWGQFYGVFREQLGQFVGYLLTRLFLGMAVFVLRLFVVVLVGGAIALVTLLFGAGAVTAFGGLDAALSSVGGQVVVGAVVLVGVLAYLVVVEFPLRITLLTFFTAYELAVLGAADKRLALLGVGGSDGGNGRHRGADREWDERPKEPSDETGFVFDVAEPKGETTGDDADADDGVATPDDDAEENATTPDDATGDGSDDDDDFSRPFWRS